MIYKQPSEAFGFGALGFFEAAFLVDFVDLLADFVGLSAFGRRRPSVFDGSQP